MKKIYLILLLTIILYASPILSEERALEIFNAIKQSEYSRVVALWDNEMKIKTQSHSSGKNPIDNKDKSTYYPHHNPKEDYHRGI